MLMIQSLQISQRKWPQIHEGKLGSLGSLKAACHSNQFVMGSKAMHRSAAAVAGKPGKNMQGGQHPKQAAATQAIEYAVPMPLQPPLAEN